MSPCHVQMFPRHAMEYLMENDMHTVPENLGQLAKMNQSVTILFTDIVGEQCSRWREAGGRE